MGQAGQNGRMHLAPPTWRFVPEELDAGDLAALEPLFAALLERPITSVADLRSWLVDESELCARIAAERARRYIRKTCHTDAKNPLAKAGAENSADELKAWIRTPKDMITKKGKKGIMPAYGADKISDADLENLVAHLATMK